jgi:hypothetical protein
MAKYATAGLLRDRPLDADLQDACLAYIRIFGFLGQPTGNPLLPDAMVFGHTHAEGMVSLGAKKTAPYGLNKGLLLVNDGGFIQSPKHGNILGSFLEIESKAGACRMLLHVIERLPSRSIETRVKEERTI